MDQPLGLRYRSTTGSGFEILGEGSWRLSLPAGDARGYRLAQLDDHMHLARKDLPWKPPLCLRLRARVSDVRLPGTWGFGFWNDPFSANLGLGGMAQRLPALPNAAWFFHACERNHLAFSNDQPGSGFLTGVYCSPLIPPLLLAPAGVALPLLAIRPAARLIRSLLNRLVQTDATRLECDPTEWREYALRVGREGTQFTLDGETVFSTPVAPRGNLGLVVWIDNQFAAFRPDGRVSFGRRENPQPAWLDVCDLGVETTVEY